MLYIAADHAGFELKEDLIHQLAQRNIIVEDFGTFDPEQNDSFVVYANKVSKAVLRKNGRGILICGTGQGMAMAANRHRGIRAAVVWNEEVAKRSREEDDVNIIALPARLISSEQAWQLVSIFLSATFSHEDRYKRRIKQLDES